MPLNGNMLMKIWTISVFLLEMFQKTHKLACEKLNNYIVVDPFFSPIGQKNQNLVPRIRKFEMSRKKMKIQLKTVLLNPRKISAVQSCFRKYQRWKPALKQHCLRVNQRWNNSVQRWFWCSKNWFFSADQSWISAAQRFSVEYSVESELRRPWSVPIISESEVISTEILSDLNPGNFIKLLSIGISSVLNIELNSNNSMSK